MTAVTVEQPIDAILALQPELRARDDVDAALRVAQWPILGPTPDGSKPYAVTRADLFEQAMAKQIRYKDFQRGIIPSAQDAARRVEGMLGDLIPDVWGDLDSRTALVASVVKPAQDELKASRVKRDLAALVLVEEQGWKPVHAYRIMGISRGLFVRVRSRGPAKLPKIRNPEKQLREHSEVVNRLEPVVEVWREVRNPVIYDLFDQRPYLTNRAIGDLFGVSGQRITMMRTQGR
jgi:hypothetical protein